MDLNDERMCTVATGDFQTYSDDEHQAAAEVLAGIRNRADPTLRALIAAAESAGAAGTPRSPGELFAVAAEVADADRAPFWLDYLVAEGHLTAGQRQQLAAEGAVSTLGLLLRRAELAGFDPYQVLRAAVTDRSLDGAGHLTEAIQDRITKSVTLDPIGDSYASWVPKVANPAWAAYLDSLAAAADARRIELGTETASQPPQWAIEALGPIPSGLFERAEWEQRAGIVAAHRELTGHDDPAVALGPATKVGQLEHYASWRAAWRALGWPDAGADEAQMSARQLEVRIRAYDRELTWAPAYVAHWLVGTRQAAAQQRETGTKRLVEAADAANPEMQARLESEAAEAAALAEHFDARVAELEFCHGARAQWLAHTAQTRANAYRARHEQAIRLNAEQSLSNE